MNKLTEDALKVIILRIIDNANDAFKDESRDGFAGGKRLAYYEILDTVKNELLVQDVDVSEFGLDIDLDTLL